MLLEKEKLFMYFSTKYQLLILHVSECDEYHLKPFLKELCNLILAYVDIIPKYSVILCGVVGREVMYGDPVHSIMTLRCLITS
jgi:hypothetical protein